MYISVGFYCVFTQASCCCAAQLPSPSIQSTSHLHVSSPRRHPFNTAASCPVLRMNALSKCSPAKLRFTFAVILYTRHFASALLCAFDSRRIRVFSGVLQLRRLGRRFLDLRGSFCQAQIHISKPTSRYAMSYAIFCLKK